MAKRFTDSDKWKKPWYRGLSPLHKCFWQYITDNCDMAGIWEVDFGLAEIFIGQKLDESEIKNVFMKQYQEIDGGKRWFLLDFTNFQYGELRETNRMHGFVLKILKKYGVSTPLKDPSEGAKDLDLDKVKDLKEGLQGEKTILGFFDLFWAAYPARNGKKLEKAEAFKAFKKVSITEHNLVVKAATHYANSGQIPKDPKRFLNDYWREWIEPSKQDSKKPGASMPANTMDPELKSRMLERLKNGN